MPPNVNAVQLWLWYPTGNDWVKAQGDANGRLVIDPSDILEDTPTDGETAKAPTSNWAYDHEHNVSAHHVKYTDAEAIAAAKTDSALLNYNEGARVWRSAAKSIANATWTMIDWDSETYDTDSIHDNTTNPTRLTCRTAGLYLIVALNVWLRNATGARYCRILLNGTTTIGWAAQDNAGANDDVGFMLATTWELSVNDYVEYNVLQTSGGALNFYGGNEGYGHFIMHKIGA